MNIGTLLAQIGADTKSFDKALKHVDSQLNQSAKKMQSVGKKMSMYISAPMAAIGGASLVGFKNFETELSKVEGLVGVNGDQVSAWRDDLLQMAPDLGAAPKALSKGLFYVTSAGQRGSQALDTLEISAKASAAGLGEIDTIANIVTSAMAAYGSDVLNAAKSADILTATVREGKAEAPELAASLGQVLPIASAMDVQFHDVGATIAAMTRTGTEAATASMQLKNVLTSLLKPTTEAETAMFQMGTSSKELREQIGTEGLFPVLEKLKNLTGEYGEEIMAKVFPNVRALSGVLDLVGGNMEDNRAIFERMKDTTGTFSAAFDVAADTVNFKMNQALSRVKESAVILGEAVSELVIPIIDLLSKALQNVAEWFDGLSDGMKKTITILGGLVLAAGPVLTVVSLLIQNLPLTEKPDKHMTKDRHIVAKIDFISLDQTFERSEMSFDQVT